jgi:hypothetical protein
MDETSKQSLQVIFERLAVVFYKGIYNYLHIHNDRKNNIHALELYGSIVDIVAPAPSNR